MHKTYLEWIFYVFNWLKFIQRLLFPVSISFSLCTISDASICFPVTFPPFENSDYIVFSVSIDFPKGMLLFNSQLMMILVLIRTAFVII